MASIDLETATVAGTVAAIAATAAPTAAPTPSTDGFLTCKFPSVRILAFYSGTVSACNIVEWVRDRQTGIWYAGAATNDLDPLTGAQSEARDFFPGRQQEVFFQVEAVSGGGTVAVRLQPTDTGMRWMSP